jgi:hypothetical protein
LLWKPNSARPDEVLFADGCDELGGRAADPPRRPFRCVGKTAQPNAMGQHAVATTMRRVVLRSDHNPFRTEIPKTGDMLVTVGRPPRVRAASRRSGRRASDTFTAGFDVLKASANEVQAARTTDDATRSMAH